jgi:acetyl-CoA C-acetyltransferase
VAAGEYEVVLAIGAEKMRDVTPRESLVAKTTDQTHPILSKGRTAPGQFALVANRYLATYGYPAEILAEVSVKNHEHATRNPKAHFRRPVTREQVLSAPRVADPLGVLDCTPTTDGAAAVVVTSRRWAERNARRHAIIRGVGLAVIDGYFAMQSRAHNDLLGFEATRRAADQAYKQAGISDLAAVFHSGRHFTAQQLVDAGAPQRVIEQLLGHSSRSMTARYSRDGVPLAQLAAAMESRDWRWVPRNRAVDT